MIIYWASQVVLVLIVHAFYSTARVLDGVIMFRQYRLFAYVGLIAAQRTRSLGQQQSFTCPGNTYRTIERFQRTHWQRHVSNQRTRFQMPPIPRIEVTMWLNRPQSTHIAAMWYYPGMQRAKQSTRIGEWRICLVRFFLTGFSDNLAVRMTVGEKDESFHNVQDL